MFLPEHDRYTWGRKGLMTELTVLYGGRIAEKVYTNDVSTGAANDIKRATDLARRMVTQFGMSDLGPIAFSDEEDTVFLGREITRTHHQSDATLERIDEEIKKITSESYARAEKLLGDNADQLQTLATALIQYETLSVLEVKLALEGGDIDAYRKRDAEASKPPERTPEDDKDPDALPGLDRGPAPGFA
jgi:cell division protease FtsH